MKVVGTTVLARRALIVRQFGAEAWRSFFADASRLHACFQAPITEDSRLPADALLRFHDELVRRFYHGDERVYFAMGEDSAVWTLGIGPYRDLLPKFTIESLSSMFPRLWQLYFTETTSRCEVTFDGVGVDVRTFELPVSHPYFESLVFGYFKGALELICANPAQAERQPTDGGHDHHYRYTFAGKHTSSSVTPSMEACSIAVATSPVRTARGGARKLSTRELDVMRLIALGKTNREIAAVLGISAKTVQSHVANLYDKLGLCNRAGAVAWLLENQSPPACDSKSSGLG